MLKYSSRIKGAFKLLPAARLKSETTHHKVGEFEK